MRARYKIAAIILVIVLITAALSGCWDSRELNHWFILTGVGIDVTDDPEIFNFTFQVANIKQEQSGLNGGGGGGGKDDSVVTLKAISPSLLRGVSDLNRDNDNKLLFQHNQIRLFGIELAQRNIKEHLDLMLRDFQARLEVPMAVVDGRAEDVLNLKLTHEPNSGIFLGGLFKDLADMSNKYIVRLIDILHVFLDKTASPVLPIIKINQSENGEKGLMIDGMAVFKGDKMIGRLNNDETLGYILSFGNVKKQNITVEEGEDKAVLHISNLKCKREITLSPDGKVSVRLKIDTKLNLAELHGFKNFKPPELVKHLEKLAQEKIKELILAAFSTAKELKADIFGFCTMINKKDPKKWEEIKDNWDDIFVNMDMTIEAKPKIKGTGQIAESLEMEEKNK